MRAGRSTGETLDSPGCEKKRENAVFFEFSADADARGESLAPPSHAGALDGLLQLLFCIGLQLLKWIWLLVTDV